MRKARSEGAKAISGPLIVGMLANLGGFAVCTTAWGTPADRLIQAVKSSDYQTIRSAGSESVNVNTRGERGATPLLWASYLGDLKAVKILGSLGADPDVLGVIALDVLGASDLDDDRFYGSSLVAAVCEGHLAVVRHLVEKLKADVDLAEMRRGESGAWKPIDAAVDCQRAEIAGYLARRGADLLVQTEVTDSHLSAFPAAQAARSGRVDLVSALVAEGFGLEMPGDGDWTLLHHAAAAGQRTVVGWLLRQGADLDARTSYGETPLILAIEGGHLQTVRFLVAMGADLRPAGEDASPPVMVAATHGTPEMLDFVIGVDLQGTRAVNDLWRSLVEVVTVYQSDNVRELLEVLIDHGADVAKLAPTVATSAVRRGDEELLSFVRSLVEWDPDELHRLAFLAAESEQSEILASLLEWGADPDARDAEGVPLLHYVFCSGSCASFAGDYWELASWQPEQLHPLRVMGADLEARDNVGRDALSWAAALAIAPAVEELLAQGSAADREDSSGARPLDHAVEALMEGFFRSDRVIELLLAAGAEPSRATLSCRQALLDPGRRSGGFQLFRLLGASAAGLVPDVAQLLDHESAHGEAAAALAAAGPAAVPDLEAWSRHPSPLARQQAIWALGEIGEGQPARQALEAALEDADLSVRLAAVRALGRFGGSQVLPALQRALEDPDLQIRQEASTLLSRLAANPVADLRALLPDRPDVHQRFAASLELSWPDSEASSALDAMLESDCESERLSELFAEMGSPLGDLSRRRAVRVSIDAHRFAALIASESGDVLSAMLEALARQTRLEPNVALLRPALDHAEGEVKVAAVRTLGAMCALDGPRRPVRRALIGLLSAEPESAVAAAWAAGRCAADSRNLINRLRRLAGAPEAPARGAALSSLALLTQVDSVDLIESLESSHEDVRRRGAWALSRSATQGLDGTAFDTIRALRQAIEDPDRKIRCHATRAMARWGRGHPSTGYFLVPLLDDSSWLVRSQTALALAQVRLQDPYSLDALGQRLDDPDLRVRQAAAIALRAYGQGAAHLVQRLEASLGESHRSRLTLAKTLGRIGWESEAALRALVALLDDASLEVRLAAVESIPKVGALAPSVVERLNALRSAADPRLRAAAMTAMRWLPENESGGFGELLDALGDSSGRVRSKAEKALLKRGLRSRQELADLLDAAAGNEALTSLAQGVLQRQGPAAGEWLRDLPAASAQVLSDEPLEEREIRGVDELGNPRVVPYDGSSVAVLLATWCPYSDELLRKLSDPRVRFFLQPYDLTFLVMDEEYVVERAREREEITPQKAREFLAEMAGSQLPISLVAPWKLEEVPGEVVFVLDKAEVPLRSRPFPEYSHSFPAVYYGGQSDSGLPWLSDQIPPWLAQELSVE